MKIKKKQVALQYLADSNFSNNSLKRQQLLVANYKFLFSISDIHAAGFRFNYLQAVLNNA